MKLEKFKEKNSKKKFIITFTISCILLLAGVFLYTSFAVFTEDKDFNVINGTYQDPGDIYFAYYVDGQITRELPKQNTGYIFDAEQSNCTNGVIPTFDNSTWKFTADYSGYNATDYTRTKCNLYFKTGTKTVSTALGDLEVYTYTPDFMKSACDDEACESHEKGIFEISDDDGPTYYYRGSVENNYVYFANRYWRIIRINGDGSIRMIYDGTVAHQNGESSTDRHVETSQFNPNSNDNMYVGYMYKSGESHGLETSSTIKQANDNFYTSVLSSYASYIDTNAGFCGDRSTTTIQSGVAIGNMITYYNGYLRTLEGTPKLNCENNNDYYTSTLSNKGNKVLTYPIGLITVDEIMLSGSGGGVFDGNSNHNSTAENSYLTTGHAYWSMTPVGSYYIANRWYSLVFDVTSLTRIDDDYTANDIYLKPVINIRSDVTVSGDGTIDAPFQFSIG